MISLLALTLICVGPVTVTPSGSNQAKVTCVAPSPSASPRPSPRPTLSPSPTPRPTTAPTPQPTVAPTPSPTVAPTVKPVVWNYFGFISGVHPTNWDTNCGLHTIPPYGCINIDISGLTIKGPPWAVGTYFRAAVDLSTAPALRATAVETSLTPFPGSPTPPAPAPSASPKPSPKPTSKPTPTPSPIAVACQPPFNSKAGIFPCGGYAIDGFEPMFSKLIPANPKLASYSADAISNINSRWPQIDTMRTGVNAGDEDYLIPIYWSTADDPLYTISCNRWGGGCGAAGQQIHVPIGAQPEQSQPAGYSDTGSDHHMSIVDSALGRVCDLFQAPPPSGNGGDWSVSWGNCKDQNKGENEIGFQGTHGGQMVQPTVWSPQDALAGNIGHALGMYLYCLDNPTVYPFTDPSDGPCDGLGYGTWLHYGDWVQLDMSVAEINAQSWPKYEKDVAIALQKYGGFMSDVGNGSGFGWQSEAKESTIAMGYPNKWVDLANRDGVAVNGSAIYFSFADIPVSRFRVLDPCVRAAIRDGRSGANGTC